jgi:Flp pilus assembly protein TadD
MTVESFFTRELNIRFMDDRVIVTEAKLSLGIHGSPTKDQEQELQEQAIKIFRPRPEKSQAVTRRNISDSDTANTMERLYEHDLNNMSVESFLANELNIRFMDARLIVAEAKFSLRIHGSSTKDQKRELREQAIKIFRLRPEKSQAMMRRTSGDSEAVTATERLYADFLEAFKNPVGSLIDDNNDCDDLSSCSCSLEEEKGLSIGFRMSRMFWPMRRIRIRR